ncbi:hypothetical protein OUZ56_004306 [Daphnia magna]|uniref:Secreted protein n=1 Tax=Daphnia magna TaxID=35525 RepID=A0ABQ9YPD2_9CRUS|nr:hypothetical protein OUZ56_004306 [Daphnia magna]
MCFKGFFVKKFTFSFCMCWCFALSAMPAAEPAACIPAINWCVLLSVNDRGFIYFVLLTISPQHPRYPDFQVSLISQPSSIPFSSSLWLLFLSSYSHGYALKTSPFFELQIFIFLWYNTAVLTISVVSPPVDHTQLHFLRLLVVVVYDFTSSLDRPQWPSPQGALGNAPVGTSLCRCGGGFLRVCIPCNGFRHRVSPDLSSDKSHLVRDP